MIHAADAATWNVGLGVIHDRGELGHLRPDLIGDGAPLYARGLRRLGEGGGDEGGNDTAAALAGVGQHIAHEMNPGAVEEVLCI